MAGARRRRDKGTHENVPACRPGVGTDFGQCRRSGIDVSQAATSRFPAFRASMGFDVTEHVLPVKTADQRAAPTVCLSANRTCCKRGS
jgi:hypothetical protein